MTWKEWRYCKGLKMADNNIWLKVYAQWNETNNITEYLTCSEDQLIISNYLMMIIRNEFSVKSNVRAYLILLIIAKHAKNNAIFQYILQHIDSIEFTNNR